MRKEFAHRVFKCEVKPQKARTPVCMFARCEWNVFSERLVPRLEKSPAVCPGARRRPP